MSDRITAPKVQAQKAKNVPIVCVTAYDRPSAEMADASQVDVILVGDSLGNVVLGYDSTIPVSLEDMVHHTRACAGGVKRALLVADLPFGSYQASVSQAVDSAVALLKAGAHAVKLEGPYTEAIRAIIRAGIPVMGHVGMTPQSVNVFGGFRVQGKGDHAEDVIEHAKAIEGAGAFAIVLELVPRQLAKTVTAQLSIPTIGIGAGPNCDGQIQVFHDILGLGTHTFKHVKVYAKGRNLMTRGLRAYAKEVRERAFPADEHSF